MIHPVFHLAMPRTPAQRARAVILVNTIFPLMIAGLLADALAGQTARDARPVAIVAEQAATR